VEVRVLGPLEVIDAGSVVRLAPAERTLLAALAARAGERVSADVLEEALWPEGRPPSARKALQGRVFRLRRVLGAAAIGERGGGYRLDPDQVAVDAVRVSDLVGEARAAIRGGDAEAASGLLDEARGAFRGQPYDGIPETVLPAGELARLDELCATVVEESVEAALVRGCGDQCVGQLEAFLEANPYRERAWGLLMRALYQAGRPADALAAYGRARVVLVAELGIEPGPALRDVERAILVHDARILGSVPVVGLGPSNQPAAVTPIVGRHPELATLESLLQSERLVTLTGVGGIGKTRLAIEAAGHTGGQDPHGPYFLDLAPVADVGVVPVTLAETLGIHVEPPADPITLVRTALGDHSVVVVIDNCEHLLPGIADLVGTLLAARPAFGSWPPAANRSGFRVNGCARSTRCASHPLRRHPSRSRTPTPARCSWPGSR
jgi:DNA-binding SARP family transcriptional activator